MKAADRRVRAFAVPEHLLLTIVEQLCGPPAARGVVLPQLDLPADAAVVGVEHDRWSCSFQVFVRHDSFDELADGEMIPRHPARFLPAQHPYILAPLGSPEVPDQAALGRMQDFAASLAEPPPDDYKPCPTCDDDGTMARCTSCGTLRVDVAVRCPGCGEHHVSDIVDCPTCHPPAVEIRETAPEPDWPK
jgi:hypothetical protein